MSSSGSATPGWYPDPHDPAQIRYWDGATWTEAVAPATEPAVTEPADPSAVDAGATATAPGFAPPGQAAGQPTVPGQPQAPGVPGSPGSQPPPFAAPGQAHQPGYQGIPTHEPGPPHGLGQVSAWLSAMFSVTISRGTQVLTMLLVPPVVLGMVSLVLIYGLLSDLAFDQRIDDFTGFDAGPLIVIGLLWLAYIPVAIITWVATHHQLFRAHAGQPESLGQSLSYGLRRLPRVIGWGLLLLLAYIILYIVVVAVVVGLVAAIGDAGLLSLLIIIPALLIGGVYLFVRLSLVGVALAVGPKRVNPIRASWDASAGRFWPLFGRLLLLGVVLWGLQIVSSFVPQIIGSFAFASIGVESNQVTGEILVDGVPVEDLDVISVDLFLPNIALMAFIVLLYIVINGITQALQSGGMTGLYLRSGAPSDLDEG